MANRGKSDQRENGCKEYKVGDQKRKILIRQTRGFPTIDMGVTEIWDGRDLAQLRIMIQKTCVRTDIRTIGIDMKHVQYLPEGIFGMLCDWVDRRVTILLVGPPTPRVARMLWFRLCCEQYGTHEGVSQLFSEPRFAPASDDDSAHEYAEEESDGMLEAV